MTIPDLTNENRQPLFRKKRPAWLKWLMRIVIVICVFIAIALGVLSFVSGSSPELEESFEQRLSEIFQKKVTFERLNYVEVFPTVTVDVEGVIARPYTKIELARIFDANTQNDQDASEDAATPDITPEVETYYQEQDKTIVSADALLVKVSFFDIVFGFKQLKDINIQDLRIIPENPKEKLIVKRLELDPQAYLKDDGQRAPGLIAEGSYDGVDFSGQAALNVNLNANRNIVKYRFGDPSKFVVSYGPLSATGLFELQRSNTLSVDDFVFRHKQEAIFNGHFRHIVATSKADRIVKGEIKIGESALNFNMQQVPYENLEDASLWTGEVIAAPLQLDDIIQEDTGFKLLLAGIDELKTIKAASSEQTADESPEKSGDEPDPAGPIEFSEPFFDINVNVKEIYGGDIALGQGQFQFLKTHDTYAAKDIIGTVSKGDLSGHITLAKQDDRPQFDTKLEIRQLDYGDLQRAMTKVSAVDGKADMILRLSGAGNTQ